MKEWTDICAFSDLTRLVGVCALVNGVQIALFLVDEAGQLFAVDNYDPFSKANVLSRGIVGDIGGELVVASPIYKQHFSLRTGQCLEDKDIRLVTYAVRVVEDRVQIGDRL